MNLNRFAEAKKKGTLEQEFLAHNPELDRFIIEGMLEQPDVLLEEFSKAGVDKALVLRRAADCGISDSILRQMKRVAADLAGEKGQRRLIAQGVRARGCLSCERVFLSTGAGNRLCSRCRGNDAGLAAL